MPRTSRAVVRVVVAVAPLVALGTFAVAARPSPAPSTAGAGTPARSGSDSRAGSSGAGAPGSSLEGLTETVTVRRHAYLAAAAARAWYEGAARHEAALRAAQERSSARSGSGGSRGRMSGSCAALAPEGFPAAVVWRESRGDPHAVNDESGAYGCAQLLPEYLTGDYRADWARLWNGGAGACHWNPPNYCAGS